MTGATCPSSLISVAPPARRPARNGDPPSRMTSQPASARTATARSAWPSCPWARTGGNTPRASTGSTRCHAVNNGASARSQSASRTATITAPGVMSVHIPPGTHAPASGTALGQALLGRAPHTLLDEEREQGVRTLAVPIHDRTGRTVAAAGLSFHAARHTPRDCTTHLLPPLLTTARAIESDLGTATRFTHVPTA